MISDCLSHCDVEKLSFSSFLSLIDYLQSPIFREDHQEQIVINFIYVVVCLQFYWLFSKFFRDILELKNIVLSCLVYFTRKASCLDARKVTLFYVY